MPRENVLIERVGFDCGDHFGHMEEKGNLPALFMFIVGFK
jgi:hypothetical protein